VPAQLMWRAVRQLIAFIFSFFQRGIKIVVTQTNIEVFESFWALSNRSL